MSLLVIGTASHVGKSTVVAALCRILTNRGIKVAPFKSQNMSLNSFITSDGAEIGIAQAMQALAARVEPDADMNPILLKPKGEMVSQVVLKGRPWKDVRISEYYQETDYLLSVAVASAHRLLGKFGHIVAEGAGGAAEINLYSRDIANIRIERELRLPVLLVADIERGGVFAQVYGTLSLLPEDIRPRVMGVIINKFRGDPALFEEGVQIIEDLCGIPVLGILPVFSIPLPSEDSLSLGDKRSGNLPVPENVPLKDPASFKLIGKHSARVDSKAKSMGKAQFTQDVQLPGMLVAVVAHPPRFGATVKRFDATAAKALPGVKDVVQIPTGVAVLADGTWPAKKGRDALT
ncbi:MAG TPA: cobyric acid synthase, partial [Methanoregulaceae archaeon]|nr:cobyric acid synthase [Methanoregulaceae archaeon]